ncbi:MAG: matrixin family metalloprotease [Oligoflexia bacterium]|nr:matrixin family metalloprotease [Oligoflexia bacterium]
MKNLGLLITLLLFNTSVFSYTFQINDSGTKVRWPTNKSSMIIYLHTQGTPVGDSSTVNSIVASSASSWNGTSAPDIVTIAQNGNPLNGRNDLYFSNDASLFGGTGVLAVTKTSFDDRRGVIIESDIVIRDDISYSLTQGGTFYLGDIITHEMGHFLGMDHSERLYSSMFYTSVNGQYGIHSDDYYGVNDLYSKSTNGELKGTVAGSESVVGVLGAEVVAISTNSGRVLASAFTDINGSFSIKGLPLDDVYYVYVKPPSKLSSLPSYYEQTQTQFCAGGQEYRGSFYESCNNSERGKPLGIKLTSGNSVVDLGTVTIKCGLSVDYNYFNSRSNPPYDLGTFTSNAGEAIVGYFSPQQISDNEEDNFQMDLTGYPVTSSNLYLEVKIINQDLYSRSKFKLEISSPAGIVNSDYSYDLESNPNLNLFKRYALSTTAANNLFDIKVTPEDFDNFVGTFGTPSEAQILPGGSYFADSMGFYLMVVNIVKYENGTYSLYDHKAYTTTYSNTACMDAPNTYKSSGNTVVHSINGDKKKKNSSQDALACGSVDMGGSGPGNGFFSLVLGVLLMLLSQIATKRDKSIF